MHRNLSWTGNYRIGRRIKILVVLFLAAHTKCLHIMQLRKEKFLVKKESKMELNEVALHK